jgi:hypothetical protein
MNDGLQIGVVASQLLWYCSKKMQILEHMKVTNNFEFDSTHMGIKISSVVFVIAQV